MSEGGPITHMSCLSMMGVFSVCHLHIEARLNS